MSRAADCAIASSAASKAGLLRLTKVMALELAAKGVHVNALAPGNFETGMHGDFEQAGLADALRKAFRSGASGSRRISTVRRCCSRLTRDARSQARSCPSMAGRRFAGCEVRAEVASRGLYPALKPAGSETMDAGLLGTVNQCQTKLGRW